MNANDIPGALRSLELLAILCDALVKGAVLLFAAGLITMAMRKAPAAARHLVWAITLCGVLVLPLFSAVVPSLRLPILPPFTTVAPMRAPASHIRALPARTPPVRRSPIMTVGALADHSAMPMPRPALRVPVTPHVNANAGTHNGILAAAPTAGTSSMTTAIAHWMAIRWPLLLLAIWSAGVAMIGLIGLMGYMRLAWRLARARTISTGPIALLAAEICRELKLRRPVRIAIDESLLIPLAHGVFRPCVLLPAAAESWPSDKLRAVLLHELAHVARWDCASLLLGQIACTLHWPDPLVWWSWRRLRSECERACDDAVLRCSTVPADYAENLLTIARDLRPAALPLPLPATLAMARPSELKGRIVAILDERRNRRPIPVGRAVGMLLAGTLIVASFAALHLQAKAPVRNAQPNNTQTANMPVAQRKTMTLTVIDKQTGKPLAGVKVFTLRTSSTISTTTDGDGRCTLVHPERNVFGFAVVVQAPHYVREQLYWGPEPEQGSSQVQPVPESYTLALPRGTQISGRVVDDAGTPVAGAHVMLWLKAKSETPHERPEVLIKVRTKNNGAWQYDGVPANGVASIGMGVWDRKYIGSDSYVPLQTLHNLTRLRDGTAVFILHRGITVDGVVRGPNNKPVAGAKVALGSDINGDNTPQAITTYAMGRFAFVAKRGSAVIATATAPNYGPSLTQATVKRRGTTLILKLTAPHLLTGKVVNTAGQPLAHAMVIVDTWHGYRTLQHLMRTDSQGRFDWAQAPAGKILVDVQCVGYAYTQLVLVRAENTNVITLRHTVTVHGTVVNAKTGKPIRQFTIIRGHNEIGEVASAGKQPAIYWDRMYPETIAGNGSFAYTLPNQRAAYAIRIEASGYLPADSRLFHNNKRNVFLSFKLTPAPEITAKVLNLDGSLAVGAKAILIPAGHNATIYFPGFDETQGDTTARIGANGQINFVPQKGNYQIVIYDHNGCAILSRSQMPKSGAIHLLKWGHIEGLLLFGTKPGADKKILASASTPMVPMHKSFYFAGVTWWITTHTDSAGRFDIPRFPAGKASVTMRISGPFTGSSGSLGRELTVPTGKTVRITLGGEGQTVDGRIVIPQSLINNHNWHFEMGDAATQKPAWFFPKELKLPATQRAAWARSATGKAFFTRMVRWMRTKFHEDYFIVASDGTFSIPDAVPGTYQITIYATNPTVHVPVPRGYGYYSQAVGTVCGTFTVPPIPGGVTDVPLKIPPLKLVPVKAAKPADPPAPAPAVKTPLAVKTVPAMALTAAPRFAQKPKTMILTVIDKQTGKPLPGVSIKVWNGGVKVRRLRTNADGTIGIPVPEKIYSWFGVEAIAKPSYIPMLLNWLKQPGKQEPRIPTKYTLPMTRGVTISGRVVDDDGKPVAGAQVRIMVYAVLAPIQQVDYFPVTVTTDVNGRWYYGGVPTRGVRDIEIGVWDYKYVWGSALLPLHTYRDLTALRKGKVTFTLRHGVMVHGIVRDPNGKPLAGAEVLVAPWRFGTNIPTPMTTDHQGLFAFAATPGQPVVITATAKCFGAALTHFTMTASPKNDSLELTAPHNLAGQVVDSTGHPVPGVGVSVDLWHGYRTLIHYMQTDRQGRFGWIDAPGGTIDVDLDDGTDYAYTMGVHVIAGHPNILTLRHTITVHGTVVDAKTGKPVKRFTIIRGCVFKSNPANASNPNQISWNRMYPQQIAGDGSFAYTLPNQRAAYAIRIEADGYLPADSRLFHNNKRNISLRFQLVPSNNIVVTVTTPDGKPAANVPVELVPARHMANIQSIRMAIQNAGDIVHRTDSDGQVRFGPQSGDYKLIAFTKSAFAIAHRRQVIDSYVKLLLQPAGNIRVKLLFGTRPVAGQVIGTSTVGSFIFPQAKTDASGEVLFKHLPAGRASVAWMIKAPVVGGDEFPMPALSKSVVVEPGKTVFVTIGGTGRPLVGQVIIPASLKFQKNWRLGAGPSTFITTIINVPPLPIPPPILHAPLNRQLNWYKSFINSKTFKTYWDYLDKEQSAYFPRPPVTVQTDGSYRIEDVVPGTYQIQVDVWNPVTRQEVAIGSGKAVIGPIKGGVSNIPLRVKPFELHLIAHRAGNVAPDFVLKTIDGKTLRLSQFRGKYVLLYFWTDIPKGVKPFLSVMQELHESLQNRKNFIMIGVYCVPDAQIARMFAEKYGLMRYQVYLPLFWSNPPVLKEYPGKNFPTIWLIGPDGRVKIANLERYIPDRNGQTLVSVVTATVNSK